MDLESALPASVRALPATREPGHVMYRMQADGCEVLFVVAAAGFEHAMHDHDTDNVTVVVTGAITLETGHGKQQSRPADWYETAAGELHGIRFDADTVAIELRFDAGQQGE